MIHLQHKYCILLRRLFVFQPFDVLGMSGSATSIKTHCAALVIYFIDITASNLLTGMQDVCN